MKNNTKCLFLLLFCLSGVTSTFAVLGLANTPKVAQTTSKSFVSSALYGTQNWDPAIIFTSSADYYTYTCLERLVWVDADLNINPELAESWIIHPRPGGGTAAIEFTLRQGVTFHDGSEWNATVCKWNLDRSRAISKNLTIDLSSVSGTGNLRNTKIFWIDASQFDNVFTADWNLSWYQYEVFGPEVGSNVPIINNTEIISDYVINITYNTYDTQPSSYDAGFYSMISMESYGDDYTESPIIGTGDTDPPGFPGHMIGTGPYQIDYIFEEVTSTGHMTKYDDYWNATAMEAEGLFSITDVFIRHYADEVSRDTAVLTGEIDHLTNTVRVSITDLDSIKADPLLDYYETTLDTAKLSVCFKSYEGMHTPCPEYGGATPAMIWQSLAGFPMPGGVNRTVRRAMSYALDHPQYLQVVNHGLGNISTNLLGLESQYYNPAINEPDFNITRAREILLSDPFYEAKATARGLTIDNTTAEWNQVGMGPDPIGSLTMVYNIGYESQLFVEEALYDIGFRYVGVGVQDFVQEVIYTGQIALYDIWLLNPSIGRTNPWGTINTFIYSKNRFLPYQGFNFMLFANDTIDDLLADIYTSDDPQLLYDELADQFQNYHVPFVPMSQYQRGFAINTGWNFTAKMPERIGWRELPYYAWIGGERETKPAVPPIPGYDMYIISVASIFTLFGVIYAMMRKRNNK